MNASTYTPNEGSHAWKTIQFLTTNPDEALSADDVAAKFDCSARSVHTLLGPAVAHGILTRTEDLPSGDLVYRLGKGHPGIRARAGEAPSLTTSALQTRPKRRRGQAFTLDPNAVVIEDDVPLKPANAHDWDALLARMSPGQSCLLPAVALSALVKLRARIKKDGIGEITVRSEGDQVRLWKVK